LDVVIRQCSKCRIEIAGRTNLGRNSFDGQLLTRALQFLPVDNDPTGNVYHVSDFDHVGDQLERQFHLLASQAFGAERYAGHVPSGPRLASN
jgi:hypothetical protein